MRPRLLERYRKDVVPRLSKEFSYRNVHQVPKLEKIVGLNVTLCTTANSDAEARALLAQLGVPFRN